MTIIFEIFGSVNSNSNITIEKKNNNTKNSNSIAVFAVSVSLPVRITMDTTANNPNSIAIFAMPVFLSMRTTMNTTAISKKTNINIDNFDSRAIFAETVFMFTKTDIFIQMTDAGISKPVAADAAVFPISVKMEPKAISKKSTFVNLEKYFLSIELFDSESKSRKSRPKFLKSTVQSINTVSIINNPVPNTIFSDSASSTIPNMLITDDGVSSNRNFDKFDNRVNRFSCFTVETNDLQSKFGPERPQRLKKIHVYMMSIVNDIKVLNVLRLLSIKRLLILRSAAAIQLNRSTNIEAVTKYTIENEIEKLCKHCVAKRRIFSICITISNHFRENCVFCHYEFEGIFCDLRLKFDT